MEITDPHVHYWEPSSPSRPWDSHGKDLGPPLSVEDLLAVAADAGVTEIVQVTPSIMGYDNRYSFEGAERYPDRIAGVFARFDPIGDGMAERFAALRRHPKFIGIRFTLFGPPTASWLTDGSLDPFMREAATHNVPVAIFAPNSAKELGALARSHPGVRILVDHMALSSLAEAPFERWPDTLALAGIPNVWVKASYFPEVAREPYPFPKTQARFKELFERFGAGRLIWGSNYPPSKSVCSYEQSVDFTLAECAFLSDADKRKLFSETFWEAVGRRPG